MRIASAASASVRTALLGSVTGGRTWKPNSVTKRRLLEKPVAVLSRARTFWSPVRSVYL